MGNMTRWNEIKVTHSGIDKVRCGLLLQGDDSIVDYYSKVKRCNNDVNLCEKHLRREKAQRLNCMLRLYIATAEIGYSYDSDR